VVKKVEGSRNGGESGWKRVGMREMARLRFGESLAEGVARRVLRVEVGRVDEVGERVLRAVFDQLSLFKSKGVSSAKGRRDKLRRTLSNVSSGRTIHRSFPSGFSRPP
jgi:hypothetical protein